MTSSMLISSTATINIYGSSGWTNSWSAAALTHTALMSWFVQPCTYSWVFIGIKTKASA